MSLVRADQARLRIREEMERKKLVQREVADMLEWTQSRLAKVLTGRVELTVSDLEALCFAVGISMVEALRDRGVEFCAEMTPTELRLVERMRQLDARTLDAVMQLLDVRTKTRMEERRALPKKAVRKKM